MRYSPSMLLTLAFALTAACLIPKTEETVFEDEGEACVVRTGEWPDLSTTLTADDNLSVTVFFPVGCLSSSCSDVERAECDAMLEGNTITVTSSGLLVEDVSGRACTADCGMMTATCSLSDLEEGSYTIVHGDHTATFELPGEPACAGEGDS